MESLKSSLQAEKKKVTDSRDEMNEIKDKSYVLEAEICRLKDEVSKCEAKLEVKDLKISELLLQLHPDCDTSKTSGGDHDQLILRVKLLESELQLINKEFDDY